MIKHVVNLILGAIVISLIVGRWWPWDHIIPGLWGLGYGIYLIRKETHGKG